LGLLAVERRQDGAFLGMCGLHHLHSYPNDIEVAWRLARAHWGQGYATEAATGWLDHAFGALGLPRVISITEPANLRSLAVMGRLGMVFDHQAEVEEDGVVFQAVVYAITMRSGAAAPNDAPACRRALAGAGDDARALTGRPVAGGKVQGGWAGWSFSRSFHHL
jgi:hypothetical protein